MTTERKFFSGNSLEIALMQAARHHGLQPEEVAYRKIEKRHGFLRSRKGVVIEVDPESPRLPAGESGPAEQEPTPIAAPEAPEVRADPEAAAPGAESETPEPSAEPKAPVVGDLPAYESESPEVVAEEEVDVVEELPVKVDAVGFEEKMDSDEEAEEDFRVEATEDLMDAARRGLKEILAFAKVDLVAQVSKGDGQLEIELSGPDRPRLVEDRGNLLLAIQHLLPRLIRGYTDRSIPCHVDSDNFHATREAELEKLAVEAAEEVRESQRPRTLPPMNPAERRIIHVTLAETTDVATESRGKGFFKRVTITPAAMRRPRGFDRY